jgi:hypothetical protein
MKTTLSIIAAVLLSGSAYGDEWLDNYLREGREWQAQFRQQQEAAAQREQLEEIQAQQRQIRYELEQRELFRANRIQEEQRYLRLMIEDCE